MTASKADRSVAPRTGTRPSRAKQTRGRDVTPPTAKPTPPRKPKPGQQVMDAQLADKAKPEPASEVEVLDAGVALVADPDDFPPPVDPWWTNERETAYQMVLAGLPQHQVARELDRDRHTIARWLSDQRFEERLYEENLSRFKASRQRRTMQTVRLTDKAEQLASKMMELSIEKPKDVGARMAARDWLSEFRENSRREDEIYGLDRQRMDVNINGAVQHRHTGAVDVSFKEFLSKALVSMGIENEEIDEGRVDDALAAVAEKALMEGNFLEDLIDQEKEQVLATARAAADKR